MAAGCSYHPTDEVRNSSIYSLQLVIATAVMSCSTIVSCVQLLGNAFVARRPAAVCSMHYLSQTIDFFAILWLDLARPPSILLPCRLKSGQATRTSAAIFLRDSNLLVCSSLHRRRESHDPREISCSATLAHST